MTLVPDSRILKLMGARLVGTAVCMLMLAATPVHADEAARTSSRMCANTYGGDLIRATNNLSCGKARSIVRTWGGRLRRDGKVNRSVQGYRCRGRNDRIEGLVVSCRRSSRVVRFYANVPR